MCDYEERAKDFLRKTNTKLTIEYVGDIEGFPFDKADKLMHRAYECTMRRKVHPCGVHDNHSFKFPFYGSYADWKAGKDPNEYDILSCLECYCPDTIDEFVAEYGYEVHEWADVHRIEAIYKSVSEQSKELERMFSELELEVLADIN